MAFASSSTFSSLFLPVVSTTKPPISQDFWNASSSSSGYPKLCCHFTCSHPNSSLSPVSPTTISDKALNDIQNSGIIACLRTQSAELALEAARAALDGGVTVLEIVMSTPGIPEVLKQLAQEYPRRTIGVGTVLHPNDAKNAINSGAKFLLSPAMVKEILDYVSETDALYIPGVMTPTEILSALNAGAKIVKVYPVSALGGIKYIAALKKPFPHIPMVASQGIQLDLIEEYIAQGATSVVLSDAIFCKKAILDRNFQVIYQLSRTATLRAKDALARELKIYRRIFLRLETRIACMSTGYEVAKDLKWIDAIKELKMIEKNKTWILVDRPSHKNTIGVKWVYKTKLNSDGSVNKYKAMLVAKGYAQQFGVDFSKTFALVARLDAIRMLLALAAQRAWKVYQLDVKLSFLNGYLEEEIFIKQLDGFAIQGKEDKVYLL